jgi:ketohexokinase
VRVLGVGVATLDIINTVDHYPNEDDEMRALSQRIARGGNAANTLVVLSQLGHRCDWAGSIADEPDSRHILEDLARYAVGCSHITRQSGGKVPTSYVTLSAVTGSRTIVHHRDLEEFSAADFAGIDLDGYNWVHFEGRNCAEVEQMMKRLKRSNPALPCSLEIEKPREGMDRLLGLPDLLIFSRAFARVSGYTGAEALFAEMRPLNAKATFFCAWGSGGGYTQLAAGKILHSPAHHPPRVVDTLGAGDVFNAAVIDGQMRGLSAESVLQRALRLAGEKCGRVGFDGLRGVLDSHG